MTYLLRFVVFGLLILLLGCPKPDSSLDKQPAKRPLEGLKLRLAVVDDPAIESAVNMRRGEWTAQTGAELEVVGTTEKALTDADSLPADAVLCTSHLLSVLAERKQLAPVPPKILRNPEWGEVFELLRLREAAWGNQIMAVPFGSPVFCCYYRTDLLEKLGRKPPRTWAEYEDLAKLLAEKGREERGEGREKDTWSGTIEPLGPGWAGLVLLARAAPYAKHRDNYSTLFNMETMEPMVSGPPFVQALEELVAAAKFGPTNPLTFDPAATRGAFWEGHCGMALTWPTAAEEGRVESGEWKAESGEGKAESGEGSGGRETETGEKKAERGLVASATSSATSSPSPNIPAGFIELPGSRRVFNLSGHVWDNRTEDDDSRVPLLTIAGRLGVVNKNSPHLEAAFQLLLWLSDIRMSPQISAASPATTLFRQSNLKSPSQWVEKPVSTTAAFQYADATEAALQHEQWLGALRLPGRAEYLAALDEAVAAAVRGEKSPMDALLQADAQWRKITERLGIEQQKAAYRHSLGLE